MKEWSLSDWDEEWYVRTYADVSQGYLDGEISSSIDHFLRIGRHQGKLPSRAIAESVDPDGYLRSLDHAYIQCAGYRVPISWTVHGEAGKTFFQRLTNGILFRYMRGELILDIGYRGGAGQNALPIVPHAVGVDIDFPGYDGVTLPFENDSVDTVFTSHVLEHLDQPSQSLSDWYRVVRPLGCIIVIVPHQYLYEKKMNMPSNWSMEHRRFFSPSTLLGIVESALVPNSYRVRHLADNDSGFVYAIGPNAHSRGCYEIELVLQKLPPPGWELLP